MPLVNASAFGAADGAVTVEYGIKDGDEVARSLSEKLLIGVALSLVVMVTVGGNSLVCVTVAVTRRLQTTTNYFVVSLAVADLMLAVLVLPFSAMTTITGGAWTLGRRLCNVYVSADVTLCTVSILTLFAISLDRYMAVTSPYRYQELVDRRTVRLVIVAIWTISAAMAFVPIHLGWNTDDGRVQNSEEVDVGGGRSAVDRCRFLVNRPYVIVVAFGTYFAPLVVMCVVYVRILNITRRQVRGVTYEFITYVGMNNKLHAYTSVG